MACNGPRCSPRIGIERDASGQLIIPFRDEIPFIPPGWPPWETAEFYYDRLISLVPTRVAEWRRVRTLDSHAI
jgi:hypothetical protein